MEYLTVSNFYFPNDTDYIFISFHCGSNLYFPNDIKIFFMCLLAISILFFFGEVSVQVFSSLKSGAVCSFLLIFFHLFIYSE